jgi:hypothetical protein
VHRFCSVSGPAGDVSRESAGGNCQNSGTPQLSPGDDAALREFDDVESMQRATSCPYSTTRRHCDGDPCPYYREAASHGARGQTVSLIAWCDFESTPLCMGFVRPNRRRVSALADYRDTAPDTGGAA